MPRLKESDLAVITASVGGGALFSQETGKFDPLVVAELSNFFRGQIEENHTVIAVIGGGPPARDAIKRAQENSITGPDNLDRLGIQVTWKNAAIIKHLLTECGLPIEFHRFNRPLTKGVIYVRGGNRPGHTTDFVAVQAAYEAGQKVLLNITSVPGVFPVDHGHLNKSEIISELTWDTFLSTISTKSHIPGINTVFDRKAAQLAQSYGMTVAIIGGPDPEEVFTNVNKLLRGQEFRGTLIHP